MNHPVLLIFFSLSLWGLITQNYQACFFLQLLFFAYRFIPYRINFSLKQYFRTGDFITLLIIASLLLNYATQQANRPIYIILEWLPAFYAPALLAQMFGREGKLPLGTLFYSQRQINQEWIDFRPPYACICLLAAGSENLQNNMYFAATALILILFLWTIRNKERPVILWLLVILSGVFVSFHGFQKLHDVHIDFEKSAIRWLSHWMTDPYQTQTSIGRMGQKKLSNRIVLRVKTDHPLLLHQASYDNYLNNHWYASDSEFDIFTNHPKKHLPEYQLSILQTFDEQAILALPLGTTQIEGLGLAILSNNTLGAIKAIETPDYAEYQVTYSGLLDSAPTKFDLQVPAVHQNWITRIEQNFDNQQNPEALVSQLLGFFQNEYKYSLYEEIDSTEEQAINRFMLMSKSGHCEYFAVATVMMLRHAGIPARLANGYSVQEYNDQQNYYIVRERHAHAWALAYWDGTWHHVDSTPSQWLPMESSRFSEVEDLKDWFRNLFFQIKVWQVEQRKEHYRSVLIGILILLIISFCVIRLYSSRKNLLRATTEKNAIFNFHRPAKDSEFYLIEKKFSNSPQAKNADESYRHWLERIKQPDLSEVLELHLRYRHDPKTLNAEERKQLKVDCKKWLKSTSKHKVIKKL